MNIAHIVLSLEVGGLEVLVYEMTKNLVDQGHRCTVYCLDREGTLAEEARRVGVEIVAIHRKPGVIDPAGLRRLRQAIRNRQHGIVHTHNIEAMFYGSLATIGLPGVALIHTQHGLPTPFGFLNRLKARISGWFVRRFVGVSSHATDFAVNHHLVSRAKALTILNGINTTRFMPDRQRRQQTRQSLGLAEDSFVAICVARLSAIKNHARLLAAYKAFVARAPEANTMLLIVGDGERRRSIESQVIESGLTDRVRLLGESKAVESLLAAADVFVLASDSEGISVSILEAMAAGLPVVVTDVGGNGEIVRDGENGFLVPVDDVDSFADRWVDLLRHPEQRQQFSEAARQHVIDRFSLDAMVANYLGLYGETIDGK